MMKHLMLLMYIFCEYTITLRYQFYIQEHIEFTTPLKETPRSNQNGIINLGFNPLKYAEIRNCLFKSHIRDEHALRFISVFKTNGFNIEGNPFKNGPDNLCIDASRFNHCCISNLDRTFDGSSIEIRAIRSIEENDDLCLSDLDPTRLVDPPTITNMKVFIRLYNYFDSQCQFCSMSDGKGRDRKDKYPWKNRLM